MAITGGDIYIKPKQKKARPPRSFLKAAGVLVSMLVVIVGVNSAVVAGQNALQSQTANTITDTTTPHTTPGIMQFLPNEQTPANNTINPPVITPLPTTTFNQPLNQPITQPFNQPLVNPPVTNPTVDLGGIMSQINQTNTAILSNMQTCVQITHQAQSQVAQLRATEQQLLESLNQINRQNLNLNLNDPNAQAMRAQLIAQREQIMAQRNQTLSTLSQTKGQFYRAKADCQNSVFRQQSTKRNLENQLNNAFQRSITINLY